MNTAWPRTITLHADQAITIANALLRTYNEASVEWFVKAVTREALDDAIRSGLPKDAYHDGGAAT